MIWAWKLKTITWDSKVVNLKYKKIKKYHNIYNRLNDPNNENKD